MLTQSANQDPIAMIEVLTLFVVSMPMHCPPVAVSEDERQYITSAAYEARSSDRRNRDFETVTVRKCVAHFGPVIDSQGERRLEQLSLYAAFPHDIQTDRYRERYSVRCNISTSYVDDAKIDRSEFCQTTQERFVLHDRLPEEVSLEGDISVEEATAFLDYIIDFDQDSVAQKTRLMFMSMGGSIDAHMREGKPIFRITIEIGGDSYIDISSEVTREPELQFHGIR